MTNQLPDGPGSWTVLGSVSGDGSAGDSPLAAIDRGRLGAATALAVDDSCFDRLAVPLAVRLVAFQRRLEPQRPLRVLCLGRPPAALIEQWSRRLAAAGGSCQLTLGSAEQGRSTTAGTPPAAFSADELAQLLSGERSGAIAIRGSAAPPAQLLYPGAADAVLCCRVFDSAAQAAAERLVQQLWRAQPGAVWVLQASSHPALLLLRRWASRRCRLSDPPLRGVGQMTPPPPLPRWSARRVRELLRGAGFLPTPVRYAWPGVWLLEAQLQWAGQPADSWWRSPARNSGAARPATEGLIGRGPS
jgi:hypothetical protein